MEKLNNRVYMEFHNGIGDRLLDLLGIYIVCKYLGYTLCINFETDIYNTWGIYDTRLFVFPPDIELVKNDSTCCFRANMGGTYSPYRIYEYLKRTNGLTITFQEICEQYRRLAKHVIQPSPIILNALQSSISPPIDDNTYGIHLRCSDRVRTTIDERTCRYITSLEELNTIMIHLLDYIGDIINIEGGVEKVKFLLVSENEKWKCHIAKLLTSQYGDGIQFVQLSYSDDFSQTYHNFVPILDFFALSKCKCIIQGIKYSSFSTASALIGKGELINFGHKLVSSSQSNLQETNLWKTVLHVNHDTDTYYLDDDSIDNFSYQEELSKYCPYVLLYIIYDHTPRVIDSPLIP